MALATIAEKHSNLCIVTLIGLPGSGKTTFVKAFSNDLKNKSVQIVNVCYDNIVPLEKQKEFASDSSESSWKEQRKDILSAVESLISGTVNQTNESVDQVLTAIRIDNPETFKENGGLSDEKRTAIVIDDNNYYPSMRYKYFQLSKRFQIGYCQLYFQVDLETALSNNAKRDETSKISEGIIREMHSKLVPPDFIKNSWEQFSFALGIEKIDTEERRGFPFEMCFTLIKLAFENPSKLDPDLTDQKEASRSVCNANIIHQSDKILRKMLSNLMNEEKETSARKEQLAEKSKFLNEMRIELLEDLKTGFTRLPSELVKGFDKKNTESLSKLDEVLSELYRFKLNDK